MAPEPVADQDRHAGTAISGSVDVGVDVELGVDLRFAADLFVRQERRTASRKRKREREQCISHRAHAFLLITEFRINSIARSPTIESYLTEYRSYCTVTQARSLVMAQARKEALCAHL